MSELHFLIQSQVGMKSNSGAPKEILILKDIVELILDHLTKTR